MSAFHARSALRFELVPSWFCLETWGSFEIRVVMVLSSVIRQGCYTLVYFSRLDRLQRWKARNRQTATCGRRIDRLQLRATEMRILGANISQLDRLQRWTVLGIDRLQLPSANFARGSTSFPGCFNAQLDRLQRWKVTFVGLGRPCRLPG